MCSNLGLGVLRCLGFLRDLDWYFSASTTFVGLGVGKGGDCSKLLAVVGEGVDSDELLVVDSGGLTAAANFT